MTAIDFAYNILSVRVIDGDTVECYLDLGFRLSHKVAVRLNGINAPEPRGREAEAGVVARTFVDQWFNRHGLSNIHCVSIGLDKYGGRIIGNFIAQPGIDQHYTLTTDLISEGLAKPYHGKGPIPRFSDEEIAAIVERADV